MDEAITIIPERVEESGQSIEITPRGAVFTGENPECIPPETIIALIKKLAMAETACGLAEGDLVNFLIGAKGKDLAEIAAATGISAGDLTKRAKTCERIAYNDRQPELHLDFHIEAAHSKADEPSNWLKMATQEDMTRKKLKRSIELGRLATDDEMKPIIEEHDAGTDNFGTSINKIVILDGKLQREGNYDDMTPEQFFDLHQDLLPVVEFWSRCVARFKGQLSAAMQGEFDADLKKIEAI